MSRPGGEADKLGNRYEGIWTVGRLLEVARGTIDAIAVEPFGDEASGIEFVETHLDGTQEFHSVKRQRAQGEWSLYALTNADKATGRSVLGDLLGKLGSRQAARCVFVSGSGANDLHKLTDRARRRPTFEDFEVDLNGTGTLRSSFDKYVGKLVPDSRAAYGFLRRLEVALQSETTLERNVDLVIELLVYRPDARTFQPLEVRLLLGQFILDNLGSESRAGDVWAFLAQFGYAKKDWVTDATLHDVVRQRNEAYVRTVEGELINGIRLARTDATRIIGSLTSVGGAKTVLVSAPAGVGKSCVIAQVLETLGVSNTPTICIRMDRHADARTTQELGIQLGLPRSPCVVLAGMANGAESVLIVDQLDAVSQVSGRYPHLWEVFDSLCREADRYPNMRLVVACRDFDLQHDARLRALKQPNIADHISIELLSIEEVETALGIAGCESSLLNAAQKEILRTPLHLFLLLEGRSDDTSGMHFRTIADLFDSFWQRKQKAVNTRVGQQADWTAVVDRLCDVMSRDLRVCAPAVVLDAWTDTTSAMQTEHILVRDENQIRFFHESFFDYAFARRFCASSGNVIQLLREGEQHLFRRSQVRQILTFMRDHSRDQYLLQLRQLLVDPKVRFHIKRLVFAWLGTVPDPTAEEWEIIEEQLADSTLLRHALPPIRNSLSWCDLLIANGILARWIASTDEALINRAVWILMFDQVQKHRSKHAAKLLGSFLEVGPEWTNRLLAYFRFGNAHHSRPIQLLFLKLLDAGAFEASEDDDTTWWDRLHDAGEQAPRFALEAITIWLDNRIKAVVDGSVKSILDRHDRKRSARTLISDVARREPLAYVDEILPRLLTIISHTEIPSSSGLRRDTVWGSPSNSEPGTIPESLLDGLMSALECLAASGPDKIEARLEALTGTESCIVTHLLLRAWSANPARFTSQCVQFLIADPRRLTLGYGYCCGAGNQHAAVSRETIRTCIPHATIEEMETLEAAIRGMVFPGDDGKFEGWTERLLLEAFGEAHLTPVGKDRLAALRVNFPDQDTEIPPKRDSFELEAIGSPVPEEKTVGFSDEQWLAAMREHNHGWEDRPAGELKGSAVELSRVLQRQVRTDRRRFAALAHKMEDSIRPEYFDAILDGLCGAEPLPHDERQADIEDFNRLDSETILGVVRRLDRLPNRPSGRSICTAFMKLAKRTINSSDLAILAFYATDDPDPASDDWIRNHASGQRDFGDEAYQYGYNTVRGHAATAIETLLFADYSRSAILLPLIRKMVRDPSLAVRTCAVDALLPVLNHDRNEAVQLFLQAAQDADEVFACHPFESFIRYSTSTHYAELRPLLQSALQSASDSNITVTARQVSLAAFHDEAAEIDAQAVRTGNELMRCAAAEVYSHNFGHATVRAICEQHLLRLFADDSAKVRAAAADCFLHLDDEDFNQYVQIIQAYIDSPAFPSEHDDLLRRLGDSQWQLPEVTIRLAERFVTALGAEAGDVSTAAASDASTVSKLVVRLYAQSTDESIRSKCLDLIDEMERLAFFGIDSQLAEHDR